MTQKTKRAARTTTAQTAQAPSKGAAIKNNISTKKSQERKAMTACGYIYGCIANGLFEKKWTALETIARIKIGLEIYGV